VKQIRFGVRVGGTVSQPSVLFVRIDQGGGEEPAADVHADGQRLVFTVPSIRGELRAELDSSGHRLLGTWQQGTVTLPIALAKADERAVLAPRPQEPARPYPYDEIEVAFANDSASITIGGTLTLPRTAGPHAVALLISGSGPQDRNQEIFGHRPFLVIADFLTRRGIGVLRVDDRGVGATGGRRESATIADYASDARSAVRFLRRHPAIDGQRIGLIGHSEGGLVASLVAEADAGLAFIVLLGSPALSGAEISLLQARTMLRAAGAPPEAIEAQTRIQAAVLDVIARVSDESIARAQIREILRRELIAAGDSSATQLPLLERQIEPQVRRSLSPWARFFLAHDPRPGLAALRSPVLVLYGGTDSQVPAIENAVEAERALAAGANRDAAVHVIPGLNHLFQTSPTGAVSEYAGIAETFAPAALEAIGDWIRVRVRR
jgi:pimeloyl-ACP methyl ester carboxylesterase